MEDRMFMGDWRPLTMEALMAVLHVNVVHSCLYKLRVIHDFELMWTIYF